MYDFCFSPIYAVSGGTWKAAGLHSAAACPASHRLSCLCFARDGSYCTVQALLALGGLMGYATKGSTASLGARAASCAGRAHATGVSGAA